MQMQPWRVHECYLTRAYLFAATFSYHVIYAYFMSSLSGMRH